MRTGSIAIPKSLCAHAECTKGLKGPNTRTPLRPEYIDIDIDISLYIYIYIHIYLYYIYIYICIPHWYMEPKGFIIPERPPGYKSKLLRRLSDHRISPRVQRTQ